MRPFDFIILFFSIVYALALTHLLLSVTTMIRYRGKVMLSDPLLVWMLVALAFLVINWLSLWDFHELQTVTIWPIAVLFVFSINVYLVCALIAPSFERDEDFDLRTFQDRQRTAYLAAFASLGIPLFVKRHDVQIVCGLALVALSVVYVILYYPALH